MYYYVSHLFYMYFFDASIIIFFMYVHANVILYSFKSMHVVCSIISFCVPSLLFFNFVVALLLLLFIAFASFFSSNFKKQDQP